MPQFSVERRAALTLIITILIEGSWVVTNWLALGPRFPVYLGFAADRAGDWLGWLVAILITALYVAYAVRLPSVRANLFRPSFLKLLAILLGFVAGILEEVFFRKLLMDWLAGQSYGVAIQILASGLVFGIAHGIWGLLGRSMSAAVGAFSATGVLGLVLGLAYVAAGRSLAPCIVSHFLIDVFIEPGLVLAALRGEMQRRRAGSTPG